MKGNGAAAGKGLAAVMIFTVVGLGVVVVACLVVFNIASTMLG